MVIYIIFFSIPTQIWSDKPDHILFTKRVRREGKLDQKWDPTYITIGHRTDKTTILKKPKDYRDFSILYEITTMTSSRSFNHIRLSRQNSQQPQNKGTIPHTHTHTRARLSVSQKGENNLPHFRIDLTSNTYWSEPSFLRKNRNDPPKTSKTEQRLWTQ